MNNFKEQLQSASWKLSTSEKSHMRKALKKKMAELPAGSVVSSWQWWHISPRLASFSSGAVMILIILMGETAYAAQGSLPGDLLYPVKIHVTEPVQLALATNPEQKAQVNADIASQRVSEAQTLAVQGKLTATTTQELQDNFNAHASEAIALANTIPLATTAEAVSTSTATSSATSTKANAFRQATVVLSSFTVRLTNTLNEQDMILKNLSARIQGTIDLNKTGEGSSHGENGSQQSSRHKGTTSGSGSSSGTSTSTASSTSTTSATSTASSTGAVITIHSSATTSIVVAPTSTATTGNTNSTSVSSSPSNTTQTSGSGNTQTTIPAVPTTPVPVVIPPVVVPSIPTFGI